MLLPEPLFEGNFQMHIDQSFNLIRDSASSSTFLMRPVSYSICLFQPQPRCCFLSHRIHPDALAIYDRVSISTEMPLPEPPGDYRRSLDIYDRFNLNRDAAS